MILHILSGDLWGGAEAQVLLQLSTLRDHGHAVELLLLNDGAAAARYQEVGIPCVCLDERAGILKLLQTSLLRYRKNPPEVIVSHGYKEAILGFILARYLCRPLITTFHGVGEQYQGVKAARMACYSLAHRFIARFFAARCITVSASVASELGFSRLKKLEIVHNVVKSETTRASTEQIILNKQFFTSRPALVMVGRLVSVKRVDLAIEALGKIGGSAAHLYLIGDGDERTALQSLAQAKGVSERVHFLGFRTDARDFIRHADLLLITSDSEGMPTVLLEAISECTPIVARNLPGISEVLALVPDFPALLVGSPTPERFAIAIERALSQAPAERPRLPALESFEQHFSPTVAARRLADIYQQVREGHETFRY